MESLLTNTLPYNLQFFAEPNNEGSGSEPPAGRQQQNQGQHGQQSQTPPAIDYAKIQKMLEGTLSSKEDTALKAYFRQQGLSQQEAEQAMASFKAEKAKNQPDVGAMQSQIEQAQQAAMQASIEKEALLMAPDLGVDLKTMPYLMKLAEMKDVTVNEDIDKEKLKTALNKVLEDLPQLRASKENTQSGFRQIGASGNSGAQNVDDQLAEIFGNKK